MGQGRHKEDRNRRTKGKATEKNANIIGEKQKNSKRSHKYNIKVTQPTQNSRLRGGGGVPSTWQGIGHHNKRKTKVNKQNRDYNTASGSSHWASQLERRPMPSFGGCLHSRNRPSCFCCTSFKPTPLPPSPGLGPNGVLSCFSFCTSSARRFATLSFSLTKQRFHVLICRFFNTSEPLTRSLRCQRPLLFDGQVKRR